MTDYDCVANIEELDWCNGHCETCMWSITVDEVPEDWEECLC